jgi:HK97 family phage major capsid protein
MSNRKLPTGAIAELKYEKIGHFFRALAGRDDSIAWCTRHGVGLTKAAQEFPDTAGGFLTPQDFDAAIIEVRETVGAFRRDAQVRPTSSDSSARPRRVGGVVASFVAEGQAIPLSQFLLDAVISSQKKMAVLVAAPSELFEDSASDLGAFLANEIGYAFAATEDDAGFNGDGTSVYRGIRGLGTMLVGTRGAVAAATGHNTFLTIDGTDLANLMAQVLASAVPGSAWYTSAMGYAQLFCRLAGISGGLVAEQRADGTIDASYLGFPVRFSAKLPDISTTLAGKPMLYFGNLAMSSMIVERRQMIVAISRQHNLDTDQYLVRGTERMDIINHSTGDAVNRGPVAMLVGTT